MCHLILSWNQELQYLMKIIFHLYLDQGYFDIYASIAHISTIVWVEISS